MNGAHGIDVLGIRRREWYSSLEDMIDSFSIRYCKQEAILFLRLIF
jgi:hypothetical protein